jgi:hypothetical protein
MPIPPDWNDQSVLSFLAPQQAQRVGMLVKSAPPALRASYTVFWEPLAEPSITYEQLCAMKPAANGVTLLDERPLGCTEVGLYRMYRYRDPITGWIVQQSQTIRVRGDQLVSATLTADPMTFADRAREIERSGTALDI